MKIDIRDSAHKEELKVVFADQKKINIKNEQDQPNGTIATFSAGCAGKNRVSINNGNFLLEDWENLKRAVEYIIKNTKS